MRFKRNIVTTVYSAVFILLMLTGLMYTVVTSYDSFEVSGMGLIYAILMGIGVVLVLIGAFFLREKGALKPIQAETAPLIVIEGILVVAMIGFGFYLNLSTEVESAIWVGGYLAVTYGVCRIMGGRVCGLAGVGISLALTYFAYDTGWAVLSTVELLDILCILVPFFTFLIVTKYLIPQFGKESFIVVCSLVVQSAIFGAAIVLNPLASVLCVGCVLSLLFANLRTVDTSITKGPVMAVILLVLSGGLGFGVSILMEKDFFALFSINTEPGFQAAMDGGDVFTYALDKFHDMVTTVVYHAFDFGIFSAVLFLFAALAGVFAIRRKLSEIGPLILTMIVALVGYVVSGVYGSHGHYLTYLIGIFAAYGIYNSFFPEFLHFEKDENAYDFDDDNASENGEKGGEKGPGDGNRESASSASTHLSEATESVAAESAGGGGAVNRVTASESEDAHFQEWRVSAEFVREDELRKERQEERERSYRVAKEQEEARAAGKSEEDIAAIAREAEDEVKAASPGRVVYTGEDSHPSSETIQASVPPINSNTNDQDIVLDFSDVVQENTDGYASTPVSTPPASIQSGIDYGPDMSQIPTRELSDEEEAQELQSNFHSDTDTIVLSGYQNEKKMHGAADLLNAINEAQIPTVEIPDVPSVTPAVSETVDTPASEDGAELLFIDNDTKEAEDADVKLAEAAASFTTEDVNSTVLPGEDEQLDNLLDRLDMSDSIKRMSASAREDMADVIEQADDQTEAEVVLVNEDYNFGSEDGEYGEVPTVSDLEDRWRAEQEMQKVSEEDVPDVVSADDLTEITAETPQIPDVAIPSITPVVAPEAVTPVAMAPKTPDVSEPEDDVMAGFDFTGNDPDPEPAEEFTYDSVGETQDDDMNAMNAEDNMDDMVTMEISEGPSDDMVSSEFATDDDESAYDISDFVAETQPVDTVSETQPVEEVPEEQPVEMFTDMQPEETVPDMQTVEELVNEPESSSEFVSFRDMAGYGSGTTPEEIRPSDDDTESTQVKITPFEPERIETPVHMEEQVPEPRTTLEPEPVVNHTEQSPVYSFTSKDVNIDIREDEGQLGIPKPGQEPMSAYVDRYAAASSRNGRPLAAELDNYEKKKIDRPVHTEEVVSHSGNGSRSYHKIILK